MRFFIFMILQVLLFLPMTSLAVEEGINPALPAQDKTEITEAKKAQIKNTYGNLPLYFIENKGQVDKEVSFYEKGRGHATFFTEKGVVLSLTRSDGEIKDVTDKKATTEAVTLSFVDGNKKAAITADEKQTGHVNYFVGNDKTKWRSDIPTYGAVTYNEVYKNIDIKFYGSNRNIEHDVIVRPGGDPSVVRFAYEGVKGLKVTEDGNLEVLLASGKLTQTRPVIYQEIKGRRVAVDGAYRILKGEDKAFTYGFTVASYDRTVDLVIDPVLVYSTYLGGSGGDFGHAIAVDNSGAAYITGETSSTDFFLVDPIDATHGGGIGFGDDAFVTKINPAGTAVVYSTYLGGAHDDIGYGIAVDNTGAAYITGETWALDFPIVNPIQSVKGGTHDAFVTKINPAGSAIVYSTYLGGELGVGAPGDSGSGIAVDSQGAAYVTGETSSIDFPLVNPVQGINGRLQIQDAFVTKINPAGSAIVYSTYLGGDAGDYGNGIAVDSAGAAYVTGTTRSLDFPLVNPIQGVYGGHILTVQFGGDAFVTKINPAGSAYTYSTYLGGEFDDYGNGIAVDNAGAAYLTGSTISLSFPLMNPIQGTKAGDWFFHSAYVSKINPAGSALIYSTYHGGSSIDFGNAIAVDSEGAVYVTGQTSSPDFPILNPIQGQTAQDAFVTKINPAGSALVYSTYHGGHGENNGASIAVDVSGSAYLTGHTLSVDFPVVNPIQVFVGDRDAFVSKIGEPLPVVTLAITPDAVSIARGGTLGYNVTATNTTATQQCFQYWENVTLPNGVVYPPTGELFGPLNVCLNGNAVKSVHLTHGVPMVAPVGAYVFNAFVGTHPTPLIDEAHFNFDVTAFNPATENPQDSWRLLENGFRK